MSPKRERGKNLSRKEVKMEMESDLIVPGGETVQFFSGSPFMEMRIIS